MGLLHPFGTFCDTTEGRAGGVPVHFDVSNNFSTRPHLSVSAAITVLFLWLFMAVLLPHSTSSVSNKPLFNVRTGCVTFQPVTHCRQPLLKNSHGKHALL